MDCNRERVNEKIKCQLKKYDWQAITTREDYARRRNIKIQSYSLYIDTFLSSDNSPISIFFILQLSYML